MAESKSATNENEISRNRLAELLNEDLTLRRTEPGDQSS